MTAAAHTSEELTTAPDSPDARVLALDIGLYGHPAGVCSMFWYRAGGYLHAHTSQLLPGDATLRDQLDYLEALAETYEEYWRISPVVVIGVTVLSPIGRSEVRAHLDAWYNPPWRRRLVAIGDYAGEQAQTRGLMTRKKLRDLVARRLGERTITLTAGQYEAVAQYTGKREKPGRDADDEWRSDETDALALPVALACLATTTLLPAAEPTPQSRERGKARCARAWELELGVSEEEAADRAERLGHPRAQHQQQAPVTSLRRAGPGSRLIAPRPSRER